MFDRILSFQSLHLKIVSFFLLTEGHMIAVVPSFNIIGQDDDIEID